MSTAVEGENSERRIGSGKRWRHFTASIGDALINKSNMALGIFIRYNHASYRRCDSMFNIYAVICLMIVFYSLFSGL
jgi:hypothetical protein